MCFCLIVCPPIWVGPGRISMEAPAPVSKRRIRRKRAPSEIVASATTVLKPNISKRRSKRVYHRQGQKRLKKKKAATTITLVNERGTDQELSSCQPQAHSSSSCQTQSSSAKKNVYLEELKCGMFIDDGVTGVQDGYSTSSNRSQRSPRSSVSSYKNGSTLHETQNALPGLALALDMHQASAMQRLDFSAIRVKLLLSQEPFC